MVDNLAEKVDECPHKLAHLSSALEWTCNYDGCGKVYGVVMEVKAAIDCLTLQLCDSFYFS